MVLLSRMSVLSKVQDLGVVEDAGAFHRIKKDPTDPISAFITKHESDALFEAQNVTDQIGGTFTLDHSQFEVLKNINDL